MRMDPTALKPTVKSSRVICRLFLIFKIIVIASFCTVVVFYYTKIVDRPAFMDVDSMTNVSVPPVEELTQEKREFVPTFRKPPDMGSWLLLIASNWV